MKIFLLILILNWNTGLAQGISVNARTDKNEYKIGDYIYLTITMQYDNNLKPVLPAVIDSLKTLEFIAYKDSSFREVDEKFFQSKTFIFSKYDSGKVAIPSFLFRFFASNDKILTAQTRDFNILVSLIDVDLQSDIKDLKNPEKIPLDWLPILLAALGIMLILITAVILYYKYRRKREREKYHTEIIILPPHIQALRSLKALEDKKLWQKGYIKEYHTEITEIIRKYFENRFSFGALEMTSGEILSRLSVIEDAYGIIKITEEFLSNADLVKFAKFMPFDTINEEMMRQAYSIVDITKKTLLPETANV